MTPEEQKQVSKRLSYVLRHHPESIGIELEAGGWVEVDALLAGLSRNGRPVGRPELDLVVEENPKRRFEFDSEGRRIRARQGHSINVDLGYEKVEPPELLYHGTADRFLAAIRSEGIRRMSRTHVHLSEDRATMIAVARRHGRPVLLEVEAGRMHRAGHAFRRTGNDVWLVDHVPAEYLKEAEVE